MIRRTDNDRFVLITQMEHARLSGVLAEHFGNERWKPPDPLPDVIRAVAMHDAGWHLHDAAPTLNSRKIPRDVFEGPVSMMVRLWSASVERAAEESPYVQLLISLHVLGLSAYAACRPRSRRELFELNRFQHNECERQVELRRKLGLSIDIPLYLGLAVARGIEAEERLRRNHCIMQLMDRLSLAMCCTDVPSSAVEGLVPAAGQDPQTLSISRTAPTVTVVDPWPFREDSLTLPVQYRAVPATPFASAAEFRRCFAAAPVQTMLLTVRRAQAGGQ